MLPTQTGLPNNRPISFAVDDVVQPTSLLWTEPLDVHVFKRFLRKALILPDAEQAVANALVDGELTRVRPRALFPEDKSQIEKTQVSKVHPLIETVDTAFAQHRPLTLSPDCIWLAMQQGFVHHIRENPETYRHRLVRHQGKETLQTICEGLTVADFAPAIADISSQIRERTDPVLHETLVCDFSTTTSTIRTASEVVLMDCYSDYFEYSMQCVCGIPKVTLLGTLADWQRVRARVEVLETFDLSWWVSRLRPILDEFVQTAAGQPNLKFWKAIYKPQEAYNSTTVTGWIADLFPYLNSPRGRSRNSLLDHPRENWLVPFRRQRSPVFDLPRSKWIIPLEFGVQTGPVDEPELPEGVSTSSFPSGLSSVPVEVQFPHGRSTPVDVIAGFFAVKQDPADRSLTPLISWSVTKRAPRK